MYRALSVIVVILVVGGVVFFAGYSVGLARRHRAVYAVNRRLIQIHESLTEAAVRARGRDLDDDARMLEAVADEILEEAKRDD